MRPVGPDRSIVCAIRLEPVLSVTSLRFVDRTERKQAVRQLIGFGPPNNGPALAELFNDLQHGEKIINRLTGVFVPQGYDPDADLIVQDVRPGSPVIHNLRTAELRTDITGDG